MILQSGIYIFVTNNTLEGQALLKIQSCQHRFVVSVVQLSTFIYRCKKLGVSFIITLLFSQLPASLRGKLSKGKEKEIWLPNLLTFPFERQPRPQGVFPWLWRWGSRLQNQGKAPQGRGCSNASPVLKPPPPPPPPLRITPKYQELVRRRKIIKTYSISC